MKKQRNPVTVLWVGLLVMCLLCAGLSVVYSMTPSAKATRTARAIARATEEARPTRTSTPTLTFAERITQTMEAVALATWAARPTETPTITLSGPPPSMTLAEAVKNGFILVDVTGDGLEWIKLALELLDPDPLEVTIPVGTIFLAHSSGTQNMVVIREVSVILRALGAKELVDAEVACANMRLGEPDEEDSFTVSLEGTPEDLVKLLNLIEFQIETFRIKQFAIWTITDNPTRNGYVGLGYFGMGSGPQDEEMDRIRTLFELAGIDTSKYQAFN